MSTWPDRPRVLLSYAYTGDAPLNLPQGVDVLIDSGAFTAHTSGRPIALDDYIRFLEAHRGQFTAAFALDVIGDPAASLHNYQVMRHALPAEITIIPTWHMGSAWSELAHLLSLTNYVGIGGMVPYYRRRDMLMRQGVRAHKMAKDAGCKLHGLGASGSTVLQLPWYSVDSSSWTIPRRRPLVYVADRSGAMRSVTRGNRREVAAHADTLRRYGLNPTEFAGYGSSSSSRVGAGTAKARVARAVTASLRSYMHAESTNANGTRYYMAGTPRDVPDITHAWGLGSPWRQDAGPKDDR